MAQRATGRGAAGLCELYESNWRSVTIEGSKIDYLNARSAQWQDVRWHDCTISELDLGQAVISRMAFEDCRIGTLHVGQSQLADVDLRGAQLTDLEGLAGMAGSWITESQLEALAPQLAAYLVNQRGLRAGPPTLSTGPRGEDDVTHGPAPSRIVIVGASLGGASAAVGCVSGASMARCC